MTILANLLAITVSLRPTVPGRHDCCEGIEQFPLTANLRWDRGRHVYWLIKVLLRNKQNQWRRYG